MLASHMSAVYLYKFYGALESDQYGYLIFHISHVFEGQLKGSILYHSSDKTKVPNMTEVSLL